MGTHWKTNLWGILAMGSIGLSALISWHNGQHVDLASLLKELGGVATGAGLISAADGSLVSKLLGK